MAKVLIAEPLADAGVELLRTAHEVDARASMTREELLADRRRRRPGGPVGHQGRRRGAGGRPRPQGRRPGRHRPGQRRRGRGHPARDHGRQRPPVERDLGRRAHRGPDPGPGPQHPPGPRRPARGALGAQPLPGGRAVRQDPRHRRPGPGGGAGRPALQRLRHAAAGLRPVRQPRAGRPDGGRAGQPGRGAGAGRRHHHPPAQDAGDDRPDRRGRAGRHEARGPAGQHGPGRDRGRGRPGQGGRRRPAGRGRPGRVRRGADHPEPPVRAGRASVVTPTWAPPPPRPRTRPAITIAEQLLLALAGQFVPNAVNVDAGPVPDALRPFLPLVEKLGQLYVALAGGGPGGGPAPSAAAGSRSTTSGPWSSRTPGC